MEPAAKLVVDAALGHLVQCQLDDGTGLFESLVASRSLRFGAQSESISVHPWFHSVCFVRGYPVRLLLLAVLAVLIPAVSA